MATVDSLDIQIAAEAKTASTTIDKLVSKLDVLSTSLNKINVSRISSEFEKLSKSMSGINGNMFKGFAESVKTAQNSMNKLAKEASKGIRAKATFDISDYQKATDELGKKFADVGKNIQFSGNLSQLEKQYESLSKVFDKLTEKEQRIISIGATSPESTVFKGLQYDISATLNKMEVLSDKIKQLKSEQPEIKIIRGGAERPKFLVEYKKQLQDFKDDMASLGQVYDNFKNMPVGGLNTPIENLKTSISKLKEQYPEATNVISQFENELARLQGISRTLTKEPSGNIAPIGNEADRAKSKITELSEKLKQLVAPKVNINDLNKLRNELSKTEIKLEELRTKLANDLTMGHITESVDDKGYIRLQEQIRKTELREEALKEKISEAEMGSGKFGNRLREAMSSANPSIASMKNSLSSLASKMKKLGSLSLSTIPGIKSLGKAIKNSKSNVSGLAKRFISLYAVMRLGKTAWESITSAQDYIENFNYFSVALGKIGEDSKKQFKKAGYDSAEEYADSFKGRFSSLQKQMAGYDVNTETGDLNYNISHNLGLDISEIMQYQAQIAQVTNSTGQLGEVSINASKGLSMLAADWSSLSNTRLVDVQNNLTSALNGQARAVYKYGIDLTQAGLQQIAYNHGISESVKNMSNASKQQLRLLGLIEGSKVAWGDLARTINQPANQLRMLQAGFKNLSRSIGNLFLPIVQKVYPYLNAMVMVLQEFVQWIAKLTGIKLGDVSGVSLPDYSDAADGMDDYADSADKASKKQKKLNDNLQGFDIINKLQDNKDASDSDKDKDKNKNIDLSGDIASALANYEKAWNKAFESAENKAVQIAEKMKKALLSGWGKGDFTELGKKFAAWINKGLSNIPWDKINKTINKIAKSVATFLNGFIKDLDWKLVGKTFAEGLNTVIEGAYTFWITFDWLKFGTSLAEGVNSFIQNFDAEKFGELLGAQLRGMIQFAFGFITNFDFTSLGTKIADSINGFFKDMGKVRQNTGLTGWQEMGQTISKSITGILDTINTALSSVKWEEVGKAIVEFLTSIDWWGILGKLVETIGTALKSALTLAISAIKEDPAGMIKALTGAFALIFTVKNIASIFSLFKSGTNEKLKEAISGGIGSVKANGFSGIISSVANLIGSAFKGSMKVSLAKAMSSTGISGSIFTGLSTAFSAVSGKVSSLGATLKKALTSEAFLASFGPVAIAVAGAIVSGNLIADRLKEAIDAVNFTGDYAIQVPEGYKKAAEKARSSWEETKKATEDTKKSIEGLNASVKTTSGKNIEDLAQKYFQLSQKTNPTASDIAVMKKYSEELSEVIPGLSSNIDKQTGAYKGSKEELDSLVSSTERAAKAQAAYNASVELYEKQSINESKIKEKEEELKVYEEQLERAKKHTKATKERFGAMSQQHQQAIQEMGTFATKVNSASEELKLLKGSKKAVASQIEKNNKIMDNAKVSTEKYAKANKTLKEKMKELGVTSKSQKDVIKELNKLVDEGEISWKDYKKIVDGNYTSVDDLGKAIKKLTPKEVEVKATAKGKSDVEILESKISEVQDKNAEVKATVTGEDLVDSMKGKISEVQGKNVTIKAYAETTEAKGEIKNLTTGKTVTIKASLGNTKEFKEKVANALKTTPFKMTAAQIFPSKEQITEYFKGITNSKAWKNAMKHTPTPGRKIIVNDKNKTVQIPEEADLFGNIYAMYSAMNYTPRYYQKGGFPEDGWFRANHGEIMGKFDNGQSVVANNKQITDGIAQAVGPAVYAAVKSAMNEQGGGSEKVLVVDKGYREITTGIIEEINGMTRSRGRSPLLGT